LSDELRSREPGDLRRIDEEGLKLELLPIVRAFNTTLHRLEQMRLQEQRFLADAAHELRTPLALVSAQAEALLVAEDSKARDLAVERLSRGLVRANRVIGQLLTLARLDSAIPKRQEWINLSESAADVLAALEPEATQKGIELSLQAPDVLRCWINAEHFDMLLGNLVTNAIRHQKGPGSVLVSLCTEGERVALRVLDDGPGIPQDQLGVVFQRFHRLHPQSGTGSGLGLSIVSEVVSQLNGEIELDRGPNSRGLLVKASWPIAVPT
jgi:signal transduction histidine kinase